MNRPSITLSFVFTLLAGFVLGQDNPNTNTNTNTNIKNTLIQDSGVIRQVTLYRDRALVTRELSIPAGEPLRTIEVMDLPEQILADSVFALGNEPIVVRAVRVSYRPATESNREVIRQFDQQLEELTRQHAATKHALDVVTKNLESLNQMASFAVTVSQTDLGRGVLNPESLRQVATFSMIQRRELAAEQFDSRQKLDDLAKQIQFVKSQRDQATVTQGPASYHAKIFMESAAGRAGKVQLNYLVGGCGWSPQYTVRGTTGQPHFDLRYCALVQQMSGEDWRDVDLQLSTASPAISAAGPVLAPLRVAIVHPQDNSLAAEQGKSNSDPFGEPSSLGSQSSPVNASVADTLPALLAALRKKQQIAEVGLDDGQAEPDQRSSKLNSLAEKIQQLELQAESKSWRPMAPDVNEVVASQVYRLAHRTSLDTRREQQLLVVLEAQLPGEMYHVATPLLTTYAYREAQIRNNQPSGLLAGPATVYLDDRFVGRTQIPSTASGQSLTLGFGADQQIRTRRELLAKQDEIKGGNRHLKFSYRLVLANFKEQLVTVRMIDRLPITVDTEQLTVQLETPQHPLSADGLYQRLQRPTGVLRWDLNVPADRHGSQAFDLEYSYTLEFDRSRIATTHHLLADIKAEIEDRAIHGMGFGGGFGGEESLRGGISRHRPKVSDRTGPLVDPVARSGDRPQRGGIPATGN